MIRICPERDGLCPNGDECPYADTRVSCKEGWRTPIPKATNLDPLQELADLGQALDAEAESEELRAQVEMSCPACGTAGRVCKGPSDDGPTHDDWIGATGGRPCCHACYTEEDRDDG